MTANPCAPSACGTCPLLGACGDPADLPPEPGACVSVDPIFGTKCELSPGHGQYIAHTADGGDTRWKDVDAPDRDPAEPAPSSL